MTKYSKVENSEFEYVYYKLEDALAGLQEITQYDWVKRLTGKQKMEIISILDAINVEANSIKTLTEEREIEIEKEEEEARKSAAQCPF